MSKVGRPPGYTKHTLKQLNEKIEEYFQNRDKEGKPYTITGLAIHLDTTRKGLCQWEKDAPDKRFRNAIKKAKSRCEDYIVEKAMQSDMPPAVAIFMLKNFGWTDKQQHEHSGKDGGPIEISARDKLLGSLNRIASREEEEEDS